MKGKAKLKHAWYLGGVPSLGERRPGTLWFTQEAIGLGREEPQEAVVPMTRVRSVEVTAEAPVTQDDLITRQTTIGVYLDSGEVAYYGVDQLGAGTIRACLGPPLAAAGVPFHEELLQREAAVLAASATVNSAEETARLRRLRDQGILTEAEFAARSAELLG
jgi:hypothetical protein